MKICVLQPDYSTSNVDYKNYDPPRNLSKLLPDDEVHHVFLNKLTTYRQLKKLSKEKFDIYINLCEGYLDWSVPSIDVIHSLEMLNLPYTGPNAIIYDPSKPLMKYVAFCSGVKTPNYVEIKDNEKNEPLIQHLTFPLFIKPAHAGDSLGVDENSLVNNVCEVKNKINSLFEEEYDDVLVEEYIAGREFTVLVAANPILNNTCKVFKPVEYIFSNDKQFKTYALKTSSLHSDANVPCNDKLLEEKLKHAAGKIFTGFSGVGYARLDFRVDANNEIYFLDINFTCSVFYEDGYEGSADYILKYDPIGKAGFLKNIIEEGMARYALKQKKYVVKGNSLNGYGIFAEQFIKKGGIIFKQEASAQHIVTKRFVENSWRPDQIREFKKYAYPISDEVYILWDNDPQHWCPQNHSCEANTGYDGLNLIALSDINKEDELTLDYQDLLDDTMDTFTCKCGSKNCREQITGTPGNSISSKEKEKRLMRSVRLARKGSIDIAMPSVNGKLNGAKKAQKYLS